jgi:hypothetical protein
MGPGLFLGFSGIAWAFEHLRDQVFEPDEDDPGATFDEGVDAFIERAHPMYEWMDGLAGAGLYARERALRTGRTDQLGRLLARLVALGARGGDGLSWRLLPDFAPPLDRERPDVMRHYEAGLYNLGAAHGVSGPIGLLTAAARLGLDEPAAVIDDAVPWLLAQRQGPRFPEYVTRLSEPLPTKARNTGWCNGNGSIALVLHDAARARGRADWASAALEVALAAARLRVEDIEPFNHRNPTLCHGSAGRAQIYRRLYDATGDERFADASRYWLAQLLDLRAPGTGTGGFVVDEPGSGGEKDTKGLLMGAAGVGLALLAAVSAVPPDWDRALLYS